ncbi:hypothetical protein EDB81DRAFT_824566 [Dactylonectria macrodidyma]|uniref:Uncharacterized protein n=1 Tax=Dactylonectria macrodidyma TaxID=307937 RepID=A0A9P9IBK8_9HYPO|nr:hypothetical protein EDB81DRAFT_824566 [Dactylonectria macrodidyma]
MGYSHSWHIVDPASWRNILPKLVEDSHEIIETANIRVQYIDSRPILDRERGIQFNGSGDDGCEDFSLSNGAGICKTNRKPYDLVVCAILLRAYQLAPDAIKISSDGRWEEWEEARMMVRKLWPGTTMACPWEELEEIGELKVLKAS